MKLKKIASVALAGVMAVSMLAGCKGGSTVVGGNDDANVPSIVAAVNDGQKATNDVKINFTSDATLENAAKKAVEMYQDNLSNANLKTAIEQNASLFGTTDDLSDFFGDKGSLTDTGYADGKTVTYFNVGAVAYSPASDAYIMNVAAKNVDNLVASLDDTTLVTEDEADPSNGVYATVEDDKYYDFSYTGKVCLFEYTNNAGVTNYMMAIVIEQTMTEQTFKL